MNTQKNLRWFQWVYQNNEVMMAMAVLAILAVMLMPLPSFLLDFALAGNLAISLLMFVVAFQIKSPLDFSSFPALLLVTTLYRLALNVATTRAILTKANQSMSDVSHLIVAFGNFVVGNNFVIGMVVFIILVIINFIVITKGAGRVAEVAARFTLDAMPGKQMAIDADLNAGLITQEEAKRRRRLIEQEADFYGAMDGASKFTRGDAIASIIITLINIIGGLVVGIVQNNMSFSEALKTYSVLTIGDGLLAQVPALLISVSAGIVVTRSGHVDEKLGNQLGYQLFSDFRVLAVVSAVMVFMAIIPGLPGLPLISMGILFGFLSWFIHKQSHGIVSGESVVNDPTDKPENGEDIGSLIAQVEPLAIEVGYGLISVVDDSSENTSLVSRIKSLRRQLASEWGILVPMVHIRDNLQLKSDEYQILINGNTVAVAQVKPGYWLAMNPAGEIESAPFEGIPTIEPVFQLPGLWILSKDKEAAELSGWTVVDVVTVISTHLGEVIRRYAHELVGRQEVMQLLENLRKTAPKLVEEVLSENHNLGIFVKVIKNLLREQIPIKDLKTIAETFADEVSKTKDADLITEQVRKSLARTISARVASSRKKISVITLDSELEEILSSSILQTDQGPQLLIDPKVFQRIITDIQMKSQEIESRYGHVVLLVPQALRRHLSKILTRFLPNLIVISHHEIASDYEIETIEQIGVAA